MDARRYDLDDVSIAVGDDLEAAAVVARVLDVDPASVALSHLCTNCGSTSHGRPLIAMPARLRSAGISIAHSHGIDAIAVNPTGPIGVDLESISRVARASIAASLLHPAEHPPTPRDVTRLWSAKEAVLKLLGIGLRLDPRALHIDFGVDSAHLVSWPDGLFVGARPRIRTFAVTDDLVAAVAW
ncbi:MAG TPA: 4'-phosphopantetheinyl transferase superfamily protein [Galbitalea sp.]|jgi:4'-phosphopantetheinyl transferase